MIADLLKALCAAIQKDNKKACIKNIMMLNKCGMDSKTIFALLSVKNLKHLYKIMEA